MLALEWIAERRIAEAVSQGALENLPGAGKPLELEDDALVPEDLRMAHRILKNAGLVPREVEEARNGERKLALAGARIEARYFRKAVRKLSARR
jgi:hypothetical protein